MAIEIVVLSKIPLNTKVEIGGFEYEFKGIEKRKSEFGRQEFFVFKCEKPKQEKIFERYKFSSTKIKKNGESYKW